MNNCLPHISLAIAVTVGQFLSAERINSKWKLPEDKFLSKKRRNLKFPVFLPKSKPIRWRAYWMHRITQFNLCIYVLGVIAGKCIYGTFDFVADSIFAFYPFYMILSEVFLELGTFIYVKYRTLKQCSRERNQKE